jgi:branched-subunit amino acid transport protein
MSDSYAFLAVAGMTLITIVTRSFFLLFDRELVLPDWVKRGLRHAPLAALAAVITPEVVMTHGRLIHTWQDARLFAVAAASAWYLWRRSLLGTIVVGMAVLVPLKLGLGW